ncbi:hypothetical protein ACKWTF_013632 [Chironomus riparius]
MKHFKNVLKLDLIPFGLSTYRTKGSSIFFNCNNVDDKCFENKLHACAIEHVEKTIILDFIACLMNKPDYNSYLEFTKKCANKLKLRNFDIIENCANSTEGSELLKRMGIKTHNYDQPLQNVPTITRNMLDDQEFSDRAYLNFTETVCLHLTEPIPKVCKSSDASQEKSHKLVYALIVVLIFVVVLAIAYLIWRYKSRLVSYSSNWSSLRTCCCNHAPGFPRNNNEQRDSNMDQHTDTEIEELNTNEQHTQAMNDSQRPLTN